MDTPLAASRLKALADPVRLSIIAFLRDPLLDCCAQDDGVCACDFETFWVFRNRP